MVWARGPGHGNVEVAAACTGEEASCLIQKASAGVFATGATEGKACWPLLLLQACRRDLGRGYLLAGPGASLPEP